MKKISLLLALFIVHCSLFIVKAQNPEIDSLENSLKNYPKEDTIRVNLLNEIAYKIFTIDINKTLKFANEAEELADKLHFEKGKAESFKNIGIYYWNKSDYYEAWKYFEASLKIYRDIGNKKGIADCLLGFGIVHFFQSNYSQALNYFNQSLKINEQIKDVKMVSVCLNNIGEVYKMQENFPEALKYYQKTLKIAIEIRNDKEISTSYTNIGEIYTKLGNYSFAQDYLQKSLKIAEKRGDSYMFTHSSKGIGNVYYHQKQYYKALNKTLISLKTAKQYEYLDLQKGIYKQLSEIYVATKNYKKAYENHLLFKYLNDSIFNTENIKKITGLEYQYVYEKEKQAAELEQQKKDAVHAEEVKRQKIVRNSFIAGFVLMLMLVLVVLRSFMQKRKANRILSAQKEEIEEINAELQSMNEEIKTQTEQLENTNHELEKLSIVASETDNGVIIANNTGKIEWINEGFTKMFGYNLQELIQNKGDSLINSSHNLNIKTHYNKCIKEKESIIYSSLNVTKSGKEIWVQTTLTPVLDNNGNINKLFAIDSDITKIKEAENQIKEQNAEIQAQSEEIQTANEKLIELDKFKEELTAMIIHDLKNPLNAIIGLAESDIVKQSGKQMLNMIMNILDVNKFENAEIQLQTSNSSVHEVSKSALSQVDLLYHQKSIKLINHIQNFYVDVDPEIIERVFINLLTNAIKYTPNNGTITLESEENLPDFIRIKITDTGQGIPKEKLHKVFGKFEQVIARKSGLGRSTGIGLTFCKLFIEAHGGEINVESEEKNIPAGKAGGSTFWFTLPAGMQGNEEINIEEEIIDEKPIELTHTEREILKPFLFKLQELEVYESTEVEKIIEQIDCCKTENLKKWKAEMDNAIDALNEEKYKKLIQLPDKI
ncbi:MAG: tetratricopeptide repeat protein [Bacteroidales bacterium]|nr:tetratricopeptide repeat protein [Bacteroidales bacterium]